MPSAIGRSDGGSQVRKDFANPGKQPAAPAPNSRRVAINDGRFQAHPVAAVKNDWRYAREKIMAELQRRGYTYIKAE